MPLGSRPGLYAAAAPRLDSATRTLDAHPLVREHFAGQLAGNVAWASSPSHRQDADATDHGQDARATDLRDAAREAHRRLYEHLKQSAPELPDNLNDMMPLYHAVAHGCKAELVADAMMGVYFRRVQRDGPTNFAMQKLGAIGSELAAVSCFFSELWSKPNTVLDPNLQAGALNWAGFRLRAIGRMRDSLEPMKVSVEVRVMQKEWLPAAKNASNLSELSLTLGDVSSAVRQGEQSVELADRSGDAFLRQVTRATLADALHAGGRMKAEG